MFLQTVYRTAAFGLYGFLHFTKSGFQNHSKYFKAEDMQIQLNGKSCIVTGANSGIGYATAEGLASRGATVYMVCRSRERGEAAVSEIQSKTGNANVYLETCDLSSVSEIKSFASRFSSNVQQLHVLFSEGKFDGNLQYARNKRVQVELTEKWAEMYKNKGIGFYSMHPGWAETPGVAKSMPGFSKALSGKLRTKEEGADTVLWLALQPKEKLVSGAFYFDRAEAPKHLPLSGTKQSHALIDSIYENLRSLFNLP